MDKIILATTLAALMAAGSIPAQGRETESQGRIDKPDPARSNLTANRSRAGIDGTLSA